MRRFSEVSTVAVAGQRSNELVTEDAAIDWERSDYDPYARTKKFCEHMIGELLADVPRTIFRPSIVLGDSRRAETTQFDMVRAFVFLGSLPVLPFRADDCVDIVPVDYVADAIVSLHQNPRPKHEIYHLSSGVHSESFRQLTAALAKARGRMQPLFWPGLEGPFHGIVERLSRRRDNLGHAASLLKVFLPYLVWNTVFDNTRVVAELGRAPAPFSSYCFPLFRFARENRFRYPYREWPEGASVSGQPRKADTIRAARERGRTHAMMDLVLEAWVAALIERTKVEWMLGRRQSLEAGRAPEAALRRLQRHAQHRFGCARGGDAAAGAARSGREERRTDGDDAEFRAHARLFWRCRAGATCRIFFRRFSIRKCAGITASSPAKARCSRASSPMR